MKTSTIVAIILATGAVVLATLAFLSKKKKKPLGACGCDPERTDACCCTDDDDEFYDIDIEDDDLVTVVAEDVEKLEEAPAADDITD